VLVVECWNVLEVVQEKTQKTSAEWEGMDQLAHSKVREQKSQPEPKETRKTVLTFTDSKVDALYTTGYSTGHYRPSGDDDIPFRTSTVKDDTTNIGKNHPGPQSTCD
jgi:hypothetical protein